MANVVFILGAGASKEGGAPLMAEFLGVARKLLELDEVGDAKESFKRVMDGISALRSVHSNCALDIENVESVFAAFEMGQTLARLPGHTSEDIRNLPKAMKVVIVKTIEQCMKYRAEGTFQRGHTVFAPEPYLNFAGLVFHLAREAYPSQRVGVLTFNYDVAADYALHKLLSVDYCLEPKEKPVGIPLLKLHGSINWAHCTECDKVVPWGMDEYFKRHHWNILDDGPVDVRLAIGSQLRGLQHCGNSPVEPEPVVVPPTWNKEDYYRQLKVVWAQAARELSEAHSIFVIGYSYPDSDAFFRYLYSLGTAGGPLLQRLWVFNPEPAGGPVDQRFRGLLGPGAAVRYRYIPEKFSQALSHIKSEFPGR